MKNNKSKIEIKCEIKNLLNKVQKNPELNKALNKPCKSKNIENYNAVICQLKNLDLDADRKSILSVMDNFKKLLALFLHADKNSDKIANNFLGEINGIIDKIKEDIDGLIEKTKPSFQNCAPNGNRASNNPNQKKTYRYNFAANETKRPISSREFSNLLNETLREVKNIVELEQSEKFKILCDTLHISVKTLLDLSEKKAKLIIDEIFKLLVSNSPVLIGEKWEENRNNFLSLMHIVYKTKYSVPTNKSKTQKSQEIDIKEDAEKLVKTEHESKNRFLSTNTNNQKLNDKNKNAKQKDQEPGCLYGINVMFKCIKKIFIKTKTEQNSFILKDNFLSR